MIYACVFDDSISCCSLGFRLGFVVLYGVLCVLLVVVFGGLRLF